MPEFQTFPEFESAAKKKREDMIQKYQLSGKALELFDEYYQHISEAKKLAYSGNLQKQYEATLSVQGSYAEPGFETKFFHKLDQLSKTGGVQGQALALTVDRATSEWRGALAPDTYIEQFLHTPYRDEQGGWKAGGIAGALGGAGLGWMFGNVLTKDLQISNWFRVALTAILGMFGGVVGSKLFHGEKDDEDMPSLTPAAVPPPPEIKSLEIPDPIKRKAKQATEGMQPSQQEPQKDIPPMFFGGGREIDKNPNHTSFMYGGRAMDANPQSTNFMSGRWNDRPAFTGFNNSTSFNGTGFQNNISGLGVGGGGLDAFNATGFPGIGFGGFNGFGGFGGWQGLPGPVTILPPIPATEPPTRSERIYSPNNPFPPSSSANPPIRGGQSVDEAESVTPMQVSYLPATGKPRENNGRGGQ